MKKAIIFGVTGQDGSHLADLLLSKGYNVIGVNRRASTDNTERISHVLDHTSFNLVQADITDAHSVYQVFKDNDDVDEVYNLAAQSHVGVSFKQPALTWDITGKGCLNILQAIVELGVFGCRFYQASSSEMFGASYDIDRDQVKYQNEETKFLPQSPYAIAKCASHYMTRLCREGYGVHASAGILFNHEGPRRGVDFVTRKITKWIGEFLSWCKSKKIEPSELVFDGGNVYIPGRTNKDQGFQFPKLRLGNLEAFRDWGYAGDYVEAMWIMLQQEQPDDYVICTGETHTIREFLSVAFGYAGLGEYNDFVVQDPEFYRPAEVDYLRGDNTKAKTKLNWEPRHSFEDLVKLMVDHDLQ
jgi:GDPmannose 4,6-dehydratase|tara:strand:- start:52 stop:1122 length:1071 start_codon:yes stop_codon:yes gene_type:complete